MHVVICSISAPIITTQGQSKWLTDRKWDLILQITLGASHEIKHWSKYLFYKQKVSVKFQKFWQLNKARKQQSFYNQMSIFAAFYETLNVYKMEPDYYFILFFYFFDNINAYSMNIVICEGHCCFPGTNSTNTCNNTITDL